MKKVILIVSLIFFSLIQNANGQFQKENSLIGIDTLEVAVDIRFKDGKFSTLESSISNKYELRLRQNDIEIGIGKNKLAGLEYNVMGLPIRVGGELYGYAISFELILSQKTYLSNFDLSLPYTWMSSGIIISTDESVRNDIRVTSEEVLDEFLNEYLSVN